MKLPILYHEARTGKLHSWECWTVGNTIHQKYGTVDGEKTETQKEVAGKNIGKANETTPKEQAESEAKSLWQKKKDTKYSETKTKAKETVFLPMLAHDLKKVFDKNKPVPFAYPVDCQPKLDGVRCMAFLKEDGAGGWILTLMSRGGKEWFVDHIACEVNDILPHGWVLDGELYIPGKSLQQISHCVKSPGSPEQQQVEYHIFDCIELDNPESPWSKRKEDLHAIFGNAKAKEIPHLVEVPTGPANNDEELKALLADFENEGWEGIIVRTPGGVYELGHRSRSLWKLKTFQDAEFEIVGFKEATGNDKGTVVWVCKTKEDKTFEVRPKGTREMRAKWFAYAKDYMGSQLTVKFQQYSDDGIPLFGVGKAIREPEDLDAG